jgi:hypothetical protein
MPAKQTKILLQSSSSKVDRHHNERARKAPRGFSQSSEGLLKALEELSRHLEDFTGFYGFLKAHKGPSKAL